jgi:hypothetical protein
MADRYWVGGSGFWNTSSTTNWSATSGGPGGASAPTSVDNVFFNAAATYTVTADFGQCQNITVTNGPVTFNSPTSNRIFQAYGNTVNIAANTQFTCPANTSLNIDWTPILAGAATCTFNSSGTNTQRVNMSGGTIFAGGVVTSVTFCTASTQTFDRVAFFLPSTTFTCAGSTITIDNQNKASGGQTDNFSLTGQTAVSMAGTTINLGTATALVSPAYSYFQIESYPASAVEPATTGINVVCVRRYYNPFFSMGWYDASTGLLYAGRLGNLTLRGETGLFSNTTIQNMYGCAAFTATDIYVNFNASPAQDAGTKAKVFTGAFTLNGSTFVPDASPSITFQSTTTLTTGTGGTAGSGLSSFNIPVYTFTGAVSMTGGTSSGSSLQPNFATVAISSTLTTTAPTGISNTIGGANGSGFTVAGNTSLTNTNFAPDGFWTQSGASTFTITSSPTSNTTSAINVGGLFTIGTGTTSITSTNSIFRNGFTSGGVVNVTGAATAGGITFESYAGSVSFGAATISTWTDVYIDLSYFNSNYTNFVINGIGGFTLAGSTKNSGMTVNSLTNSNGPITLTASNTNPTLFFYGANGNGNGFESGGLATVSGAATTSGIVFRTGGSGIGFNAATLATWTDVFIDMGASSVTGFTVTGAGGFTLAGALKNSGASIGIWNVFGPTNLTTSANNNIKFQGVQSGGGTFAVTGASTGSFDIAAVPASIPSIQFVTFSNTFTLSNVNFSIFTTRAVTFTGAVTITNPASIAVNTSGTLTISNALSISSTTLLDFLVTNNCYLNFVNLTTSSTATSWTLTNTRLGLLTQNPFTVANIVSLVDNGGLYISGGVATFTSAVSSSGVSRYNKFQGAGLIFNASVTLVNCDLVSPAITFAGGSGRNFAYSLSSPVANNNTSSTPLQTASYPEISVNTFTVTSGGGSFSITGGGSAIHRTFFKPNTSVAGTSSTLNLPTGLTSLTLQDVDFWRVTAGGAIAKPLTGTRLGNVGTITNITPATPKTVFWVGGAGAWDAARWATASGGAGSVLNYPLPQDTVTFDASSGTGAVTYPANIRVGTINVTAVPAGTTSLYCNASLVNNKFGSAELWLSDSLFCPSVTTGTFILGNTSADFYNSFVTYNGSPSYDLQTLIIADGSSGATHSLATGAMSVMPYGSIRFASLGTTTISNSITSPLYLLGQYASSYGVNEVFNLNVTANQIGSSSFNYAIYNTGGIEFASNPVINYGSCSIYVNGFIQSSNPANTAYTAYVLSASVSGCSQLGNIYFVGDRDGSSGIIHYLYINQNISFLNLGLIVNNTYDQVVVNPSVSGQTVSTYSYSSKNFSGNNVSSDLLSGSGIVLIKLGGGNVVLGNVTVSQINASPARSWYTTGAVFLSTGWNTGTAPNSKGGFLLFQ